jgi:hypothetical protein
MKVVPLSALVALLAGFATPAFATGSFPAFSLQHLLTENDCEVVPEFLGEWQTKSQVLEGDWTVARLGDGKYRFLKRIEESDASDRVAIDICVAHLGRYLFFDATFQEVQEDGKNAASNEDVVRLWIPLHFIGRLEVEKDALHFRLLADDWLEDSFKSRRLKLTCALDDGGGHILTAPSRELKKFAVRFATDPKVFSFSEEFTRAAPKEATSGNVGQGQ